MVAFAVNMGAVSTMEAVLFSHARRRRLFREGWPEDVYRWELRSSLSPVLLFALSIPVALSCPSWGPSWGSWCGSWRSPSGCS